jgi:hypothetical protein
MVQLAVDPQIIVWSKLEIDRKTLGLVKSTKIKPIGMMVIDLQTDSGQCKIVEIDTSENQI